MCHPTQEHGNCVSVVESLGNPLREPYCRVGKCEITHARGAVTVKTSQRMSECGVCCDCFDNQKISAERARFARFLRAQVKGSFNMFDTVTGARATLMSPHQYEAILLKDYDQLAFKYRTMYMSIIGRGFKRPRDEEEEEEEENQGETNTTEEESDVDVTVDVTVNIKAKRIKSAAE